MSVDVVVKKMFVGAINSSKTKNLLTIIALPSVFLQNIRIARLNATNFSL